MSDMEGAIRDRLRRHEAFWKREEVDRPLLRLRHAGPAQLPNDIQLHPEMLDVEGYIGQVLNQSQEGPLIQGDHFRYVGPYTRVPWMEALLGCPIRIADLEAGGMWAEPAFTSWDELEKQRVRDDNPWLVKLLGYTRALVENWDGNYLITQTLMRGPIDMLRAFLGNERMGLAFYDHPSQVHELLSICAEANIVAGQAQLALIPPFHGGYAALAGPWAPGLCLRHQMDSASQISTPMYREFVRPYDEQIAKAFPYTILDLHSGGTLRHYPAVIDIPALGAVSVSYDPYESAPRIAELIPVFQTIQEAKPLQITGTITQGELELLLDNLSPRGLSLHISIKGG